MVLGSWRPPYAANHSKPSDRTHGITKVIRQDCFCRFGHSIRIQLRALSCWLIHGGVSMKKFLIGGAAAAALLAGGAALAQAAQPAPDAHPAHRGHRMQQPATRAEM